MHYTDPQPIYYPGHYGRLPHTEVAPNQGILWDSNCKRIPARYVDNLVRDGFRLALTLAQAAEAYGVPQYAIRSLVMSGELLECKHEDGERYIVFDIKLKKRAAAEAERLRERRTTSTNTEE